jgi:trimethyllysine dioxygenase
MFKGTHFDNETNVVTIYTGKGTTIPLSYMWLRDHCPCEQCLHPDTRQRLLDTSELPEDLQIGSATTTTDGNWLNIHWTSDPHYSEYPFSLFENLRADPENLEVDRRLWNAQTIQHLSKQLYVTYEDFIKSDDALLYLLECVESKGFVFIENTPPTPEATKAVCERVAYIRETIFGGYYEMTANLEHKDTAYTPLAIGPHTDGTYSNDAPSYQVLHCLEERCQGGENVLVDGFKIAEVMKRKYSQDFYMLAQVQVPGQYIDTVKGTHLMARRPIFRLDDNDRLVQVSYNNHDRAPFYLPPNKATLFYRALNIFARLCASPEFHYRRKLSPGSVLFFDNWRILHARDAYSGYRKLAGAYFNKEDVESRLRVLRAKV